MKTFWALVKTSTKPGAGFTRVTVQADNTYAATQLLKGMYGSLMLSESANPI
jgi:hypothetical protein